MLIETSFGCQFITDVLLAAVGNRDAAMTAILDLTNGDEDTQKLLSEPHAGRMLKSLALGGRFNPTSRVVEPVDRTSRLPQRLLRSSQRPPDELGYWTQLVCCGWSA